MSDTQSELKLGKSLNELYEMVQNYSDEPLSEIERLAQEALNGGVLTSRDYLILEHRLPFSGVPHHSYTLLGKDVLKRERQRVHQIEGDVVKKLTMYLLRKEGESIREKNLEEYLGLSIDYLPWDEIPLHKRTKHILQKNFGQDVTIRELLDLFNKLSTENKPLRIKYYGKLSGEATYNVFNRARIDLPKIEIKYAI